jgi:hypothetical protein
MNNHDYFIVPIVKELDKLQERGFQPYEKTTVDNGRDILYRWENPLEWKKSVIQLIHGKNDPSSCRIDFHVYLRAEDLYHFLTGISLSNFLRKQFEYKFPMFLKQIRASSVIEQIVQDVFNHLGWFDRYDKKVCLSLIKEGNPAENVGIGPTGKIYPAIEKRLLEP